VTRARRLGLVTAVAVLLGGPGAPPAHAQPAQAQPAPPQPAEIRIVTLRVVPEEMYRAQINWEATLRRTVKTVSDIYEKNFQIRLVIRDVVPWTVGPSVSIRTMLGRLPQEVPIGPADLLVAFAAERCEKLEYGVARTFGRIALVQTGCLDTAVLSNTTAEAVLTHEMGHLFGAFHPALGDVDSVMRAGGGTTDRFDGQAMRAIRLMRTYDFARGVLGMDPETRRAWSAIYAEGHARDESNPLAGALGGAAMELARSGRDEEGEALLREAMAMDPTAARLRTMLGFLFLQRGRLQDAARELDAAKRLNFREVEARTELGFVLLQLGREDEALVELRDVLRIERRASRAYLGIGTILARRDRMPEAIGAFNNAIQIDPKNGPAYLRLAEALDKTGRPAEAWGAAERAHDAGEDVPPTFWQRLAEQVPTAPPLPPDCASAPGLSVDLDNPEPAYRDYIVKVRERLRGHWIYPRVAGERRIQGDLQIDFQVSRNGRLDCMALRRSSGSEILDRFTLSTIRLSQPFPALPAQLPQPALPISGTFRYGGGPSAPPSSPSR
jgi:TonB family protein